MDPIVSYAQNFEDVMLWRALGDISGGFYIDIGAQSPVVDSVSQAFHDRGWKGIHAEANPQYAQELRQRRPGDVVVEALIGDGHGISDFYVVSDTGLSTSDRGLAERYVEAGTAEVSMVALPRLKLDDLFELVGGDAVHWLKIDVEGGERAVLDGWSSDWRPWVVVIESVRPGSHECTHEEWNHLLVEKGYVFVYWDGLNRFYLHSDHAELTPRFDSPPNVFDSFQLSGTASAMFCKLIGARLEQAMSDSASTNHKLEEMRGSLDHALAALAEAEAAVEVALEARSEGGRRIAELSAEVLHIGGVLQAKEEALLSARQHAEQAVQRTEHFEWLARHKDELVDSLQKQLLDARNTVGEVRTEAHANNNRLSLALSQLSSMQVDLADRDAARDRNVELIVRNVQRAAEEVALSVTDLQAQHNEADGRRMSELRREFGELQAVSLEATRHARHLVAEHSQLATQLFQAESGIVAREAEVGAVRERLEGMEAAHEAAVRECHSLEAAVDALHRSTSWRLTAPLRLVSALLRGNLGEARQRVGRAVAALPQQGLIRRVLRRVIPAGSWAGNISRASLPTAISQQPDIVGEAVRGGDEKDLRQLLIAAGVVKTRQGNGN